MMYIVYCLGKTNTALMRTDDHIETYPKTNSVTLVTRFRFPCHRRRAGVSAPRVWPAAGRRGGPATLSPRVGWY